MATLFRPRARVLCPCKRAFSTSIPRAVSLQWEKNDADAIADTVPAYPHGPTRWYKQSRLGLYGGQRIRFGNNVGERSEVKTRRSWHPNILTRRLFSKSLDRHVQVRVSTRVLRTIDKLGGLDEYLLGEKEARIRELGESGWWLRWAIMQTPAIKARFAEERKQLGLPEDVVGQHEAEAAETQAALQETSDAEASVLVDDGEALPTDDAFQIEQPPELPVLKFRVGPNKHLILTPTGWIRTRPSTNHANITAIARLVRKLQATKVDRQVAAFKEELQNHRRPLKQTSAKPDLEQGVQITLSDEEVEQAVKEATTMFRKACVVKAEEIFATKVTKRDRGKAYRKEKKRGEGKPQMAQLEE